MQRAYRDERWKLIRYPQVNVTQLFDLANDPHERINLAEEPAQRMRVEAMLQALAAKQTAVADGQVLTVSNPRSAAWSPPRR